MPLLRSVLEINAGAARTRWCGSIGKHCPTSRACASRCSASPSSPTPTTCASPRPSRSSAGSATRARASRRYDPIARPDDARGSRAACALADSLEDAVAERRASSCSSRAGRSSRRCPACLRSSAARRSWSTAGACSRRTRSRATKASAARKGVRMKVVLFCGGLGTRLREHSDTMPKPLVNIGYRPILWHLMRYYAHYGHKDFILCLGYRGDMIREYFLNYDECMSNDFTLSRGRQADRAAQQRHRGLEASRSSTPACTRTSASGCCACASTSRARRVFLANYADGLSDLPLDDTDRRLRAQEGRRELRVGAVVAELPLRRGGGGRLRDGDRADARRRSS